MVKTLLRSSLREIRQSMGRYVAILAIVALGVGFFSGLRMSEPDMKATGIAYLQEQQLYDIRLLSTLGFTEEDVTYFSDLDSTDTVRGAVYTEFLYLNDLDEDEVLMAHSLTEGINEPKLRAGCMPEQPNECLGDANYFSAEDIGKTIRVSADNDEDTLELLAYDEYTLVGIATSPNYLNYERGFASIGNGNVSAFVLIPEAGFSFDAYYEIYLRLKDMAEPYSDPYKDQIDAIQPELETLTEERGEVRYTTLYDDAMEEIHDGEQELSDGWDEYYDGLADLEEGKQEYEDGLKEYEDAVQELTDAEEELSDGWDEYYDGKAQAEKELADAKKQLDKGESEYKSGLADWESGKQELEAAKAQLDAADAQLADSKSQLDSAKAQLDASKTQLEEGKSALSQAQQLYGAGQALTAAFAPGSSVEELLDAASQDEALAAQLDMALQAQGSSLEAFRGGWSAASQAMGGTLSQEALDAYSAQLEQGQQAYDSGLASYEEGLSQYEAGKAELDASWADYNTGLASLNDAKAQLDSARSELDKGWSEYKSGKSEAERELKEAKEKLEDAEQEIADGWAELADAKVELEDAGEELADGEIELADAYEELVDGEQELSDAYEELEDLKKPDIYVLTRNENTGYASFDNDTNIIKAIAVVFPAFFFLVAALVCMTTMKRMVDEQRTQIGVLKALGYSNLQVLGKYTLYSGTAAVAGYIVGYAAGCIALPWIIWEIYGMMYNFADLTFTFDPSLALLSFASAMLCSVGVTCSACKVELTRQSAELLRPKAPKAGKRVFLEYVTPIWKRLNFLQKVSVRNVLRYRSRLIMMLLGIGGCTALLITGFGIRDSVSSIANVQYDEITTYDYSVTFQDGQTQEEAEQYLNELGWNAEDGLLVYSGNTDVIVGSTTKNVYLVVSSQERLDGFISLHDSDASIAYPKAGEAVITIGLAEQLDLSVGDTIQLRDDDLNTVSVTVSGICDNYLFYYVYISPETYQQQTGAEPEYKTLFVHAHEGADPYAESVTLFDSSDVISVTPNQSSRERLNSMLSRMDYVVIVVVVFAAALAFVVLYNLTNINISERIREIATIKVLGFYRSEVASYVFRETYILSALGSLVGIGLGKLLHAYVMSQVQVDGIYFPCEVSLSSYAISVALTLLFTVLIALFMRKKLHSVDMAESLKSIE